MSSLNRKKPSGAHAPKLIREASKAILAFLRKNWIGLLVILAITLVFFGPILVRASSYSEGGDAMFNAWTLARDQHCILHQSCTHYADGNIYFPNKDSMLYSETQLSAGLLTLPLYVINHNPIFSYNIWTMLSFLFSGIFMYLLAKYLSRNNELVSILAAMVFEFAPFKMTGFGHLQNQSIFYLPLIVLLFLKFLSQKEIRKGYLVGAFLAMVLLFYASWYQMVFALMVIGPLLLGLLIAKTYRPKKIALLALVTFIAALTTLPLAKQYVRFSKSTGATFAIPDQTLFSSSLKDYFIPYYDTLEGHVYYHVRPHAKVNGYNNDSSSFHGLSLYLTCGLIMLATFTRFGKRTLAKKELRLLWVFLAIGIIGFIVSLGPLLKVGQNFAYNAPGITQGVVLPLPYILVDKFLPQLSFIRAIGRASIILLFSMCCTLALGSIFLEKIEYKKRSIILSILFLVVAFELFPPHQYRISQAAYSRNLSVPAVYKFIKNKPEIDDIVILRSDKDYPGAAIPIARAEDVLWAGYYNRNIFNGYSGYEPKSYASEYADFVDFHQDDLAKLRKLGLKYIIVDKQLSTSSPNLVNDVHAASPNMIYADKRYSLFKI